MEALLRLGCLLITYTLASASSIASGSNSSLTFNFDPKFSVSWAVQPSTGMLRLSLTAHTTGWVAFGFGTGMKDADVIYGWVHQGTGHVVDASTDGYTLPTPDTDIGGSNDASLLAASQVDGVTSLTYERPLSATDESDKSISKGLVPVMYAIGEKDVLGYHTQSGQAKLDMRANPGEGGAAQGVAGLSLAKSRSTIYYLHGLGMLVCWGLLSPLATFVIRFARAWEHRMFIHKLVMGVCTTTTIPLTLVVLTGEFHTLHSKVGLAFACLVVLQLSYSQLATSTLLVINGEGGMEAVGSNLAGRLHKYMGRVLFLLVWPVLELGLRLLFMPHYEGPHLLVYGAVVLLLFAACEIVVFRRCAKRGRRKHPYVKRKLPTISLSRLNRNLRLGKAWMIFEGCVLDVAEFMKHHPGGRRVMAAHLGQDVGCFLLHAAPDGSGGEYLHSEAAVRAARGLALYRINMRKRHVKSQGSGQFPAVQVPGSGSSGQRSRHTSRNTSHHTSRNTSWRLSERGSRARTNSGVPTSATPFQRVAAAAGAAFGSAAGAVGGGGGGDTMTTMNTLTEGEMAGGDMLGGLRIGAYGDAPLTVLEGAWDAPNTTATSGGWTMGAQPDTAVVVSSEVVNPDAECPVTRMTFDLPHAVADDVFATHYAVAMSIRKQWVLRSYTLVRARHDDVTTRHAPHGTPLWTPVASRSPAAAEACSVVSTGIASPAAVAVAVAVGKRDFLATEYGDDGDEGAGNGEKADDGDAPPPPALALPGTPTSAATAAAAGPPRPLPAALAVPIVTPSPAPAGMAKPSHSSHFSFSSPHVVTGAASAPVGGGGGGQTHGGFSPALTSPLALFHRSRDRSKTDAKDAKDAAPQWLPSRQRIAVYVKQYATGELTPHLCALPPGVRSSTVDITPPHSVRLRASDLSGTVVLLGSGTGILPFIDMVDYYTRPRSPQQRAAAAAAVAAASEGKAAQPAHPVQLRLMAVFRTPRDVLFKQWLEERAAQAPTVLSLLLISVTQPPSERAVRADPQCAWTGETGRLTAETIQQWVPLDSTAIVCGTQSFARETRRLLFTHGLEARSIKVL